MKKTIAERELKSNLLGRIIKGFGFPKGSIMLGLSVPFRKEMWRRKAFRLKELAASVEETHAWRF